MQRRFGQTWPTRAITLLVASTLVWALLLVVERQGGAAAQPRPATHAASIARASLASTASMATAASKSSSVAPAQIATQAVARQAASAAMSQASQVQFARGLPPSALARVCAALLRARALLARLGPRAGIALFVIDLLIARFGCSNISSVPAR